MNAANLSPLAQRLVAIGLLILLVVSVISFVIIPYCQLTAAALATLADTRFELARLEAVNLQVPMAPSSRVPPSAFLVARDPAHAVAALTGLISTTAARSSVQVAIGASALSPSSPDTQTVPLVVVAVEASGSEAAMLRFVADLEAGPPQVFATGWRIERSDATPSVLKFKATIAAAWAPAK